MWIRESVSRGSSPGFWVFGVGIPEEAHRLVGRRKTAATSPYCWRKKSAMVNLELWCVDPSDRQYRWC